MSKDEINKIINKYAKILRKNDFVFSEIYLFGSYAKKNAEETSDLDVAVIADKVDDYWNDKMKLWKFAGRVDSRIEPLLLEKRDFEDGSTTIAFEVKKSGKKII